MADTAPDASIPAWVKAEAPPALRWVTMLRLAVRMALHDHLQTIANILGMAFAYVLIANNIGSAGHYLHQATAYVDKHEGDLWVVAPGEKAFNLAGGQISTSALHQAIVTPGVDWAVPILRGGSIVKTPDGGVQNVVVVGVSGPNLHGSPFNFVKGDASALLRPNAAIIDDAYRERLGDLNLGSSFEVGGLRAHVEALTWGLSAPTGPFVFVEYDFARAILQSDSDRCSMVLVKLDGTVPPARVIEDLSSRVPDAIVLTNEQYHTRSYDFLLYENGLVGLIGMGLVTGLIVGFAIVVLSMLSSVQQNLREFGTLKAMGTTNADLRRLLVFNALGCAALGCFLGATAVCQISWAARSPTLNMVVNVWVLLGLVPLVTSVAIVSVVFAVRRIARVDPASVFR
jgi:putative ABC transport system permease protein